MSDSPRSLSLPRIAIYLGLLSILLAINDDILHQYSGLKALTEPLAVGLFGKTRVQLSELTERTDAQETLYIIVLDKSSSIERDGRIPIWFEQSVKDVNARIVEQDSLFRKEDPNQFDVMKTSIGQILLDLEGKARTRFAFWVLGDTADRKIPSPSEGAWSSPPLDSPANGLSREISEALPQVSRVEFGAGDTDFGDLLEKLRGGYEAIQNRSDRVDLPAIQLFLVSDLIHHTPSKYEGLDEQQKRARCEDDAVALAAAIRDQVVDRHMLANVILVESASQLDRETLHEAPRSDRRCSPALEISMLQLFEEAVSPDLFNKVPLSQLRRTDLFPIVKTQKRLRFYFHSPYHVEDSEAVIRRQGPGSEGAVEEDFYWLRLVSPGQGGAVGPFSLKWELKEGLGTVTIDRGVLEPGRDPRKVDFREGREIHFSYTGAVPPVPPTLEIASERNRIRYHTQLGFEKRLHWTILGLLAILIVFTLWESYCLLPSSFKIWLRSVSPIRGRIVKPS